MFKKSLLIMLLLALFAPWAAMGQETLTVYDGTSTSSYVPVYGSYVDNQNSTTEFIMPASADDNSLTVMNGTTITGMTFYRSQGSSWGSPVFEIYIDEVNITTLNGALGHEGATLVYTGYIDNTLDEVTLNFDNEYSYNGGNLHVSIVVKTASSTYSTNTYWYGITQNENTAFVSKAYGSYQLQKFLPKTTFTYEASGDCPKPKSLAIADIGTESATFTWAAGNGYTGTYDVAISQTEASEPQASEIVATELNENTYNFSNLTPNTTYWAYVRAHCESDWVKKDFTTDAMCDAPTALNADNITSNSAELTWTDGGTESSWNLRYRISNATEWTTISNVTKTNDVYTLSGLASITTYEVQVQANCPDEGNYTSTWSDSETFSTTCGAIDLSYTCGFEGPNTGGSTSYPLPSCWERLSGTSNYYPYVYTNSSYEGSNSLCFYGKATSTYQIAVLPEMNRTLNGVRMTLYATRNSYNYSMSVGYIDGNNTFQSVKDITLTTSYLPYTIDFGEYTGDPRNIAIKSNMGNSSGRIYVDNISFSLAPTCLQPTALAASAITSSTAKLSWTAGSANQDHWDIYYSTSATAPTASTTPSVTNTDANPCVIENLTASTPYYAWVRGNCGSGDVSEWSEVCSFTTACNAFDIPYGYGFETANDMGCWDVRNSYIYNNTPYTGIINSNGHNSSSYSFRFYYWSTNTTQYLVTPELSGTENGVHLEFYCKNGSNNSTSTISVGYSTTTSDDFTWEEAQTPTTSYQLYEYSLPENIKYVAFKYVGGGSGEHTYVDDIDFTVPTDCEKPTGLTALANTLGSDHITLTWTAGGAEEVWTLQYATNSTFTEGVVTIENISTNSQELTNLTANTQYYARVKANCSTTSESGWCNDVYNFTTSCGSYAIPHSYGFEEAAEMDCWTVLNPGSYTGRVNSNGYNSSSYSFSIYYNLSSVQYLVSPELNNATDGVHVEFYYKRYSSYANSFRVGYSTVANATDDDDFTWTESITNSTTSYQKFEEDFIANDIKHIAIKYETTSYSYLYVDDFTFDELPSCFKPKDLAVDNSTLTAHTATLSWTAGYDETEWTLQYSTNADFSGTPVEVPVQDNPTTEITDLAGSTIYYVRVKANCGENNSSVWSAVISFETPVACTTPTAFTAVSTGSHHASLYWTADEGQDTWDVEYSINSSYSPSTLIEGITGNHSAEDPYILTGLPTAGTMYYARVRSNCGGIDGVSAWSTNSYIYTQGVTAPSSFAVSDITTSSAVLTWTGAATNDYHENYEICFSTTNSVPTDLVENENYFTGITETTFSFDNLEQNTTYYVWVRDNCGTDGYSSWTSTNFTTLELCQTPTNLHMTAYTNTTATLAWDAAAGQSAWIIYYSTSDEAPAIDQSTGIVDINTNPYTLTDLTPETTYYAWVRGDCGGTDGQSGWSQVCEFMPSAASLLNLYTDGTTTNERIPFYADNIGSKTGIESQFIIPATDMGSEIKGGEIQKLTFYSNYGYNASYGSAEFDVKISEVDDSYFTSTNLVNIYSEAVYSGTFSYSNGKLTITLTEPYVYQGGNMIVDIKLTTKGSDVNMSWIGKATTEYQALYKPYSGSNTCYQFVPKTTITYIPAVAFTTDGNWNVAANWSTGEIPSATDNVVINATATIPSDYTATIKNVVIGTGSLTIADGGQLIHDNAGVMATVKKNIKGYEVGNEANKAGYYLIASPVVEDLSSQQMTAMGLTPYNAYGDVYDLYAWDGSQTIEWRNWENVENENHHFPLVHYDGYLYANQDNIEVSFQGTLESSVSDIACEVTYKGGGFASWFLYGNPFVCEAYLSSNMEAMAFYRMNDDGDGFITATGAIKPMEGFFVQAVDNDEIQRFTINRTQPEPGKNININLSQGESLRDRAIIRFGEGNTLEKFSFRENSTKLYIPQDGKDYAVVNAGKVGEMPVSFKAEKNGSYTLSFSSENTEFSYLHLIDNLNGADVDLLANPSYSFNAQTTDYAQRFRLVFATGSSVDGDSFAFINGMGNLSIFGIEGEATIQVIDVMGRVLSSETFSGSYERKLNVAPGVYMIRLINGNDVKVQKIVVR